MISWLFILNNRGKGVIKLKYTQFATEPVTSELEREGGTNGKTTVEVITEEGTAHTGKHFSPISETIIFNDGESSKQIIISTFEDPSEAKSLFFT